MSDRISDMLRTGFFIVDRCWSVTRDVVGAVAHLDRRGAVHRDIKANNVLIDAVGRAKLADFGLAKKVRHARLCQTWQDAKIGARVLFSLLDQSSAHVIISNHILSFALYFDYSALSCAGCRWRWRQRVSVFGSLFTR